MEKLEKKAVFSPYCGDETITSYDRAYKKRPRTFFGLFFVHYKEIEGDNRPGMCFFRFYSTPKTNCNAKTASRQMEIRRRCWGGVLFERSFIAVTNFSRHRMMEVSMIAEE